MTTLLLLLAACGRNLPDGAEVPAFGSQEARVADLPAGFVPVELAAHPFRDDAALLGGLYGQEDRLLVVHDGVVEPSCARFPDVAREAWRDDVGAWDFVDGDLVILRADDSYTRCSGADTVETAQWDAGDTYGATRRPHPDGVAAWPRGGGPGVWSWSDLTTHRDLPWSGPAPREVRTAPDRGWLAVTDGDGVLDVWHYDVVGERATHLRTVSVGAVALVDGEEAVHTLLPELVILKTADGYAVAGDANGDVLTPVAIGAGALEGRTAFAWPDGQGFTVFGAPTVSVNLADGVVVEEGFAAIAGYHLTLSGPPEATEVAVYANRAGHRPGEAALHTTTVDLSTTRTDADFPQTIEAFGFEDGTCWIAAWGEGWYFDGKRIPDTNTPGWYSTDTTIYAGPCEGPYTVLTRGVWNDAAVFTWGSNARVKTDHGAFSVFSGLAEDDYAVDFEDYTLSLHGWLTGADAQPLPVFTDADGYQFARRGGVVWTWADDVLYRADVTDRL